jgi:hypothetical protein
VIAMQAHLPARACCCSEAHLALVTNTVPNGLGGAYRLLPEGTTFSQPVTLTFHLSDMENNRIDSTFIATQHDDNFWYSQPHQIRDVTAMTVSVNATHFSDWADGRHDRAHAIKDAGEDRHHHLVHRHCRAGGPQ